MYSRVVLSLGLGVVSVLGLFSQPAQAAYCICNLLRFSPDNPLVQLEQVKFGVYPNRVVKRFEGFNAVRACEAETLSHPLCTSASAEESIEAAEPAEAVEAATEAEAAVADPRWRCQF